MNFKKFISGVSALTIAASAFAGMAVTASAAEDTSANYADSEASDYVGNVDGWTADNSNVTVEFVEGTGVKMSTGKLAGLNGMSKTFAEAYTGVVTGSIRWNTGTSTGNAANYNAFYVKDSDGVSVFEARAYGQSASASVIIGSEETTISKSSNTAYEREAVWDISYTYNTVTKAVTVTVDPQVGTETWNSVSGTAEAANVAKFATAWNRNGNGNSSYNTVIRYSIASEEYTAPAGALTVNYVAGETAIADATTPDVSELQAGDSYSYSFPKYIVNDDTLYKSDVTTYTDSIELGEDAKSVDVAYTSQGTGTYVFADFDGTDHASASNGGYKTGIAANQTPVTFTVAVDGVYSIEGKGFASAGNRTVSLRVGAKNADAIYTSPALGTWGVDFASTEDVALHAGDVVYVVGSDSRAFIDYILLTKTADLPAEDTSVALSDMDQESVTGTDNSVGVIAKGTVEGVNTVDTLTITANGETKTKTNGKDFNFDTNFGGSAVELAIIVLGVSSVDSIAIN